MEKLCFKSKYAYSYKKKVEGKGGAEKYKHLKLDSHIITVKKEISNIIGQTISKNSSKVDLSPKFNAYKNAQEKKFLDFTSENKECYNEPFTFDELLQSLNNSHDTAVCPDTGRLRLNFLLFEAHFKWQSLNYSFISWKTR